MHDPETFQEIISKFTKEQFTQFIVKLNENVTNNHNNSSIEMITSRVIDIIMNESNVDAIINEGEDEESS